jgi:hypothetical protein
MIIPPGNFNRSGVDINTLDPVTEFRQGDADIPYPAANLQYPKLSRGGRATVDEIDQTAEPIALISTPIEFPVTKRGGGIKTDVLERFWFHVAD